MRVNVIGPRDHARAFMRATTSSEFHDFEHDPVIWHSDPLLAGFWSKLWKGVKKTVNKAAPVLSVIPGPVGTVGQVITGVSTAREALKAQSMPSGATPMFVPGAQNIPLLLPDNVARSSLPSFRAAAAPVRGRSTEQIIASQQRGRRAGLPGRSTRSGAGRVASADRSRAGGGIQRAGVGGVGMLVAGGLVLAMLASGRR